MNIDENPYERPLGVDEVNAEIVRALGTDVPLRAVADGEAIYLDDGNGERMLLEPDERKRMALWATLYDYAVHFGHTNEDWDDFRAMAAA